MELSGSENSADEENEVVFAGTVKTFQMWHPEIYKEYVDQREIALAERGEGFDLRQVLNKPIGE